MAVRWTDLGLAMGATVVIVAMAPLADAATRGGDVLRGTPRADSLSGLGGNDRIYGRAGPDRLDGGPGRDLINGGSGRDSVSGGPGRDALRGGPGRDLLVGGSGKDVIVGDKGADVLRGQGGADQIRGTAGGDLIRGGGGPDVLIGGLGSDRIAGGAGNDIIGARDGRRDRVRCGPGRKDRAQVDFRDVVSKDCEAVVRRAPKASGGTSGGGGASAPGGGEGIAEARPQSPDKGGATGASGGASPRGLYAANSPWNTPIPDGAPVDPRSNQMIGGFVDTVNSRGFAIALREWTVPVYFADQNTPREDVSITAPWTSYRTLSGASIPRDARPDPQNDGHMTVIDRARGCEFDFFQARKGADGRWSATWATGMKLGGNGVYAGGLGPRGSGFAGAAGLVWPDELAQGRIDHALVASYPHTKDGGPVSPASTSDGNSNRADAIPEGARIQLDPGLNLDRLGLSRETKIIARALQEYGMYVGDTGGVPNIYAVHPYSFSSDPWTGVWGSGASASLRSIPAESFRVLALGPQQPLERFRPQNDGCGSVS